MPSVIRDQGTIYGVTQAFSETIAENPMNLDFEK